MRLGLCDAGGLERRGVIRERVEPDQQAVAQVPDLAERGAHLEPARLAFDDQLAEQQDAVAGQLAELEVLAAELLPAVERLPSAARPLEVVYQGSSSSISARRGFVRSRSDTSGSSVGHGIPMSGSSHAMPRSAEGS